MENRTNQPLNPARESRVKNNGTVLVVGMFVAATAAAIFAWNFRMQQSHQVLELYGGPAASLIRGAKIVEWIDVADIGSGLDSQEALEQNSAEPKDITQQSGLIHARAAMISDVSYQWQLPTSEAHWEFVLRFKNPTGESCSVVFDLNSQQCMCLENGNQVVIGEKLTAGLETFNREIHGLASP